MLMLMLMLMLSRELMPMLLRVLMRVLISHYSCATDCDFFSIDGVCKPGDMCVGLLGQVLQQ